jgi:predicted carbohydrate-binding protein with CBM5 and CBM33 domain
MAEKIGKVECKTIGIAQIPWNKVLIHFSLYKFRKHNTAAVHHTAQWKHDISKEIVSYKFRYL